MSAEVQPHDALYWLEFYDEREPFECVLTSQTYSWMCVLNLSTRVEETFMDTDIFQISLNSSFHGNNDSVVLSSGYKPAFDVHSSQTNVTVPVLTFTPSVNYTARVRSAPRQCSLIPSENVGELLRREESLQINSLIEEPITAYYENNSTSHAFFTDSSRSPSMLQSSVGSKANMSSWPQASLLAETGSVTCSDNYCMLSHTLSECAINAPPLYKSPS
ncbi:hypothetical protein Baya_6629 [Bagarius yarrelli]|uniref:Uncharacterized protein n=1 Tax=Bagarius yarrelli TaxID=175774 RepID=A0A556U1D7_BAGYA|nr:hypothetical protein Baya_6629 [Bagarius yarrelli]